MTCVDFNYASNLILAGTFDNQIILWDVRSKNIVSQILAHSEPITSVSFSSDSTSMISSSYDGFCRLWEVFKGNCLKTIVLEKSPPINNATFLPNMNYLLISSLNNQIVIMDLIKEEEILKYSGNNSKSNLIDTCLFIDCYNSDKMILASGSEDGNICFWNALEGGECSKIAVFSSEKVVNCISANKNNKIACAAFADADNQIIIYPYN